MPENRTFKASTTGYSLTGYEYIQYSTSAVYLTDLEGWDEYVGMDIQTAPALERAGSYILSVHASEREVVASWNFQNSTASIMDALNAFQVGCLNQSVYTLERTYVENGSTVRRETLQGLVSSIEWERKVSNATLTVRFKCVDPVKTVYLNGSSTPQAGGSL